METSTQKDKHITLRIPIRMTSLSPICHFSDDRAGNLSLLRRMRIKYGDEYVSVPVISGNSLRGQLRRLAGRRMLDLLGVEQIKIMAFHTIFSGGSLAPGAATIARGVETLRTLQSTIPPLGLFGAAVANGVIPGSLRCDLIWPVCRETELVTGEPGDKHGHELVEVIYYTRRDEAQTAESAGTDVPDDQTDAMIYEAEALSTGTELRGGVSTERATAVEVGCLLDAMRAWTADPRLGGLIAKGHGKVSPEIGWPDEIDVMIDGYSAQIRENQEAVLAALEAIP